MIAPRASGAFVCLRCEVQSATRSRVPIPTFRRLSHANFSAATSRRRDALDDHEDAAQRVFDESAEAERKIPSTEHHDAAQATSTDSAEAEKKIKLSKHPLGKIRKRKGKASLRESHAKLEIKSLGSDSSIIVLRELDNVPRPEKPSEESVEEVSSDPQGILDNLDAESAPVGQDEINKLLDNLRPKADGPDESIYITQGDYRKLGKILTKGFTVKQLSHYFASVKGVNESSVKQEVLDDLNASKPSAKRPVGRTPWYPGITPLVQRLPGPADVSKISKPKPLSKKLLVDQILRNAWRTLLLEEIESPGEIEMLLKPWQLNLLDAAGTYLGSSSTYLDHVAKTRKAKIEIIRPSIVRITAAKTNAEYAADDIEQTLRHTEAHKFRIGDWVKAELLDEGKIPKKPVDIFSKYSLQTVGKLSGAFIQPVGGDTLTIRALDKDSAEEAKRGLIRLLPIKDPQNCTLDVGVLDQEKDRGYMVPMAFKNDLPYSHRSLNLGRWTLPISFNTSKDNEADVADVSEATSTASRSDTAALQKRVHDVLLERQQSPARHKPVPLSEASASNSGSGPFWLADRSDNWTVQFGQALFPVAETNLAALTSASRSIFSGFLPGIPKIFAGTTLSDRPWKNSLLEYHFVPSPHMQNKLEKHQFYPTLKINFKIPRDEEFYELNNVKLGFDQDEHDVLLPDRVTDLCFRQSQSVKLVNALEDANVKAFSDAVCENIKSSARLAAPPSLAIEVPRWILSGYNPTNDYTRKIEYLFTGIIHREFVTSDFNGNSLVYSTSQQGKLGAKSGTLSLFRNHFRRRQTSLTQFVKSSFQLADLITEAAVSPQTLSEVARASARWRNQQSMLRIQAERQAEEEAEERNPDSRANRLKAAAEERSAGAITTEAPSEELVQAVSEAGAGETVSQDPVLADIEEKKSEDELAPPVHGEDWVDPFLQNFPSGHEGGGEENKKR